MDRMCTEYCGRDPSRSDATQMWGLKGKKVYLLCVPLLILLYQTSCFNKLVFLLRTRKTHCTTSLPPPLSLSSLHPPTSAEQSVLLQCFYTAQFSIYTCTYLSSRHDDIKIIRTSALCIFYNLLELIFLRDELKHPLASMLAAKC